MLGNRFRMLEERILPDFMEGLGWCTWDSLGQNVSEQAILDKMDEFQKLGIPVSYVLIDDGWSWVNQETLELRGFDADPVRFPGGIAQTVRLLKNRYHVKKVGVWQALKGYWYGIEDGSPAYLETAPYLQRYGDGEITVRPAADASFGFWNRWHDYLSRAGIDFIKVDGQGSIPTMLKGDSQKEEAMRSLYRGLEASAALHFHGNLINCMGMAPENVWNRSYSALSRSSDDYTPTISGSIVEHVMQNCYDNVWQGDLYLGDWDMFWSEHEEGAYSAMLRALSGGPVYISDALGHTRTDILSRLTDSDGRILSCEAVARLALDCLTRDPLRGGGILKICNTCRGAGYLGCFTWDLPGETVCEEIRWEDLPARLPAPSRGSVMQKVPAEKAERYLVYDPEKQTLGRCAPGLPFRIEMGARQARILELVPEEDGLTVLGLAEKYIPGAAIESVYRQGNQVQITVTDGGRLAAACSGEPEKVLVNGLPASFEREGELIVIHVPEKGRVTVMLRQ